MKKINNAFAKKDKNFGCFGCSSFNEHGLKLNFHLDDKKLFCIWNPDHKFDGWKNIIHGGIQTTIIDETSEWLVFALYGRSAVTMELNVKFIKPLRSDEGEIKAVAEVLNFNKSIIEIKTIILNNSNQICTDSVGKFFVYDEKKSKEIFNFPEHNDFFDNTD